MAAAHGRAEEVALAAELAGSAAAERVAVPEGADLEAVVAPAALIAVDLVEGEADPVVLIAVEARVDQAGSIAADSEEVVQEDSIVVVRADLEGSIAAEPAALAGRVDSAKVVRRVAAS